MPEIFRLFTFTLTYYQLDNMAKSILYENMDLFECDKVIDNTHYKSINIFILFIFFIFTIQLLFFSKINNYNINALLFIYIKYIFDNILDSRYISIYEHEFRRSLMWLFTTPLIFNLYCNINNLTYKEINAYIHITSNILYIVLYPFRKSYYNNYILLLLAGFESIFLYKLSYLRDKKYTMFIIYIWCLFIFLTNDVVYLIFDKNEIQIFFLLSDLIAKLTILVIVFDHENQSQYIQNNIDLQSVSLITNIQKCVTQFKESQNITANCNDLINKLNFNFKTLIPVDKTILKLELLRKILPLELEENYLKHNKEYKQFDFICVLFTDIVSYTKLANNYDPDVIYKLLNETYTLFDSIIKRYPNLQKIETIGDAYMVVSDIYTGDTINNVKNVLLFALDLLNEIQNIKTPNENPLQLRIGINLGKVIVGILGVEIPRLCVIGNTVNVANRLQTNTEANTIQISTHVYEIIKETELIETINIQKRDNVFLKNLGSRTTYVITPS